VPSPPAGPADLYARLLAKHFSQSFGGVFIVENRPGAAGAVGSIALAQAKPDGHTLLIGSNSTFVLTPLTLKNANFDPVKDFAPVGLIMSFAMYLLGRADSPFRDLATLVAYAKANPKKLNFASFGVGSIGHLTNEILRRRAGFEIEHINYQGTVAVLQALMRGEVDYAFDSVGNAQPFVEAGKLKAFAVSTAERARRVPDVPTITEFGYPLDQRIWLGLVAPARTPSDTIERLNAALTSFVQLTETAKLMEESAYDPSTEAPSAMATRLIGERNFWSNVVREANIVIE
jgi:tripartite-type tricarboxylate transporter receptor subunit TctC